MFVKLFAFCNTLILQYGEIYCHVLTLKIILQSVPLHINLREKLGKGSIVKLRV